MVKKSMKFRGIYQRSFSLVGVYPLQYHKTADYLVGALCKFLVWK